MRWLCGYEDSAFRLFVSQGQVKQGKQNTHGPRIGWRLQGNSLSRLWSLMLLALRARAGWDLQVLAQIEWPPTYYR